MGIEPIHHRDAVHGQPPDSGQHPLPRGHGVLLPFHDEHSSLRVFHRAAISNRSRRNGDFLVIAAYSFHTFNIRHGGQLLGQDSYYLRVTPDAIPWNRRLRSPGMGGSDP